MEQLRTETLAKIRDGMFAQVIDHALAEIHADCVERPRLKKPRKLTITITIKPTGEDPLEDVDIELSAKKQLPDTKIARRMKSLTGRNSFGFEVDTDSTKHADGQQVLGFDPEDGDS